MRTELETLRLEELNLKERLTRVRQRIRILSLAPPIYNTVPATVLHIPVIQSNSICVTPVSLSR